MIKDSLLLKMESIALIERKPRQKEWLKSTLKQIKSYYYTIHVFLVTNARQ